MQEKDSTPLPRVLIVDDSRIVRASIIKSIRGQCEYREESDGESAWQALMLDPSIQLLISDLTMPQLDGFGLLERLRSSRVERLRNLPVIMISGDQEKEVLSRAQALGVSDFIAKGTGSAEIIARVKALLTASSTRQEQESARDSQILDLESGLFSRRYVELQVSQALPRVFRYNSELSVLMIGFDQYQKLRDGVGEKVIRQLLLRLARLLVKKVRKEDSFGNYSEGVFAIASPQTSESACLQFANRLRETIGVASVPGTQGQRLKLSVSVGLAHSPTDTVNTPEELFDLALRRMQQAESMGGNRVIGCSASGRPLAVMGLDRAANLLKAGHVEALEPHIRMLGERLLPLLRFLDQELDAGTDLSELELRLSEQEASTTAWK